MRGIRETERSHQGIRVGRWAVAAILALLTGIAASGRVEASEAMQPTLETAMPLLDGWIGVESLPADDAAASNDVPRPLVAAEAEPVLMPLATTDPLPAPGAETTPSLVLAPLRRQSDRPDGATAGAAKTIAADFADFCPSLLAMLDTLDTRPEARAWSRDMRRLLENFHRHLLAAEPAMVDSLGAIERQLTVADALIARLSDYELACAVQRARLAAARRIPVWRYVVLRTEVGAPPQRRITLQPVARRIVVMSEEPLRLLDCIAEVERMIGASSEGQRWQRYLLLPPLKEVLEPSVSARVLPPDEASERLILLASLQRLRNADLTPPQKAFLDREPIARLESALLQRQNPIVSPESLLHHLERFEASGSSEDADRLIADLIELRLSADSEDRQFATMLETGYRNANVRFAVSEDLLNRLVPPRPTEYARVRDKIAGQPVEGHRWTDTTVKFKMIPSASHLLMSLDVNGTVASSTSATSLAATFFNQSNAAYAGSKQIRIDVDGFHLAPATLTVDNDLRLRSVRTTLDPIPLIGSLASELARSEHSRARPQANEEVRQKVYREAKQEIDGEADTRFGLLNQQLKERFLQPVSNMGLGPVAVQNTTNERELIARWRIATDAQLGSHTPRPVAPFDSLASCQVHQTAINNAIRQLELDGRMFTIGQLKAHLAAQLNRPEWLEGDDEHDDVEIAFAPRDAIQVAFGEGRVQLELAIALLRRGNQRWDNFRIRVQFTPVTDGLRAGLQREGVVQLIGASNPRSQIALRGIFGKIFPNETTIAVTPEAMVADTRLNGLCVSQFLLNDGWLSLAIGPARLSNVARRP